MFEQRRKVIEDVSTARVKDVDSSFTHTMKNTEFETTLKHIRTLPSYDRFLLPPDMAKQHELAEAGSIVFIHCELVPGFQSAAIIITAERTYMLPLPKLDKAGADRHMQNMLPRAHTPRGGV